MKQSFIVIAFLLVVGCQSQQRMESPAGLTDRLADVERARLANAAADRPILRDRSRATDVRAMASANRPPAWAAQSVVGSDQHGRPDASSLTLSEVGEDLSLRPQTEEEAAAATTTTTETTETTATSHERPDRDPPLDSLWETIKRDVKCAPRDLWRDTKRVYANPVNLVILGVAYGGSLAVQETGPDDTVEDHFNERNDWRPAHHHFKEDWRDAFGAAGNPATHFALAGAWYLLGQQTCNEKTYEVGKTLFSALMINGVTVMVGQAASWDKSPNDEYGTFPSGHTSSSFVVASVMHEAYGHVVGVPLYGLAALVAHERVEDGEHYMSDVLMGAVLGTVIGHSVASGRDTEFFGWKLLPYASPEGGAGVAFMKSLD